MYRKSYKYGFLLGFSSKGEQLTQREVNEILPKILLSK